MEAWQIKVFGIVQGVCFRSFVDDFVKTKLPKIRGFVKNMPDGSVEVWALGVTEDLMILQDACSQGPYTAKVEQIEVIKLEPSEEIKKQIGDHFRITYSF